MIKSRLLTILSVLICWFGISASENIQVVNLFEGDSLAQLNESQTGLLDFAVNLLIENDSVVILPQEVNLLIGDTAKVSYSSYPDWQSAYLQKDDKKNLLVVPTYAETPCGVVRSQMVIDRKKLNKYECIVQTIVSTNGVESPFTGIYIESDIQGIFLLGKVYSNGVVVSELKNNYNKAKIKAKRPRFNNGKERKYPNEQYKYTVNRTERWDLNGIQRW